MTAKALETLWRDYPESHLHCDVTMAGQDTYRVAASFISREGKVLASVEHYGSGDLKSLKDEAYERLFNRLALLA